MTIDTQAIRERAERLIELASKATPGKWYREPGIAYSVEIETVDKKPIAIADIGRDDCESNAAHIVANDPPTVIATNRDLLSALDREKVLEAEVESLKRYSNAHIDRAEAAEAQLATLRQQNDNLVNVLKALVEAPLRYNDKRIEIDCESHADAMARVSKARAAFPAPAQRDGE